VATRKYTFIRRQTNSAKDARYVSTDALIAARFAANGDPGIEFEALNDFENPIFVISVHFSDDAPGHAFDRRIHVACEGLGLMVRDISAPAAHAPAAESLVRTISHRQSPSNVGTFEAGSREPLVPVPDSRRERRLRSRT
jgi:hypothetical protein